MSFMQAIPARSFFRMQAGMRFLYGLRPEPGVPARYAL